MGAQAVWHERYRRLLGAALASGDKRPTAVISVLRHSSSDSDASSFRATRWHRIATIGRLSLLGDAAAAFVAIGFVVDD